MKLKRLYHKLFCVMQWNIGFTKGNIEEIILGKKNDLSFKWLPIIGKKNSIADPFIFKTEDGLINLLYEDFSMADLNKYGRIALGILDENFTSVFDKEILDIGSHVSYPFIFNEAGKTYIFPESRKRGNICCYEYDVENRCLINERVIIENLPLLDSTIFKYNNKYWLFATMGDHQFDHSKLYIYFSDSLFGPYQAHEKNPVKYSLNGTRPAGNIIEVGGEIYRPGQNSQEHYGKSITINKIKRLSEIEFEEEYYFEMTAEKNGEFGSGLHTINVLGDIIVVDGIKMIFMPITKFKNFIKKKFSNQNGFFE